MKITVLSLLLFVCFQSSAQLEGFKPIIGTICDSLYRINQQQSIASTIDYSWLVRSSKNKHIDNWGDELGNYVLKYDGASSLVFDNYFHHQLLRYCPEYLNNRHNNLFFYAVDSTNEIRYNQLRKLVIDMELSDSLEFDNYSILDSVSVEQIDSLRTVVSPWLKIIAENSYLETKRQVNREKVTYLRFTYLNYMTREREYELHFYFNSDSTLQTNHIVFRSKEELTLETERRRELMKTPPPPPLPNSEPRN